MYIYIVFEVETGVRYLREDVEHFCKLKPHIKLIFRSTFRKYTARGVSASPADPLHCKNWKPGLRTYVACATAQARRAGGRGTPLGIVMNKRGSYL